MGSRTEKRSETVEINVCDVCGEDIREPYPGDPADSMFTHCSFCKKLLCRACAKYHSTLAGFIDNGVTACPECWDIGEQERCALDELNEMACATLKAHYAEWRNKAAQK